MEALQFIAICPNFSMYVLIIALLIFVFTLLYIERNKDKNKN